MVDSISKVGASSVSTGQKVTTKSAEAPITVPVGQNASFDDKKTAEVKENIKKDLSSGVLIRKEGLNLLGIKVTEDSFVFNADKYCELTGKDITLGEIKRRYNLEPGVLKAANDYYIGVTSKGDQLDAYPPHEVGSSNVKIPFEALEKYLDTQY